MAAVAWLFPGAGLLPRPSESRTPARNPQAGPRLRPPHGAPEQTPHREDIGTISPGSGSRETLRLAVIGKNISETHAYLY